MRRLIEEGWVAGKNFVQIGLRGYWPEKATFEWMREQGMRWHAMTEIEERGSEAVLADAIVEALDGPDCIYLSVDIDVVDPGMAPATGTPESGGMLARELLRAVRQIVSQVDLVGDGRRRGVAAVRSRRDHRDPRAADRHGSDQRARRQAAMSLAFDGEIADNRTLWDAWTAIHTTGEFYDVQRFRDDPADVRIEPWERAEVGDIAGKRLLHVQCHFGLDTLSWARLGAGHVTGVDFSEPAIAFATELAAETGLADRARFVVSDVYDLPGPLAGETFDIVYTGRGALGWLPELRPWARAVAAFVRPGGIFYIHEAHPVMLGASTKSRRRRTICGSSSTYRGGETLIFPVEGSYADPTAHVDAEVEHGWNHSLGEIVTALAAEGLRIELLDEKRELHWPAPFLVELPNGHYGFPDDQVGTLPLMYSLRARKDCQRLRQHRETSHIVPVRDRISWSKPFAAVQSTVRPVKVTIGPGEPTPS